MKKIIFFELNEVPKKIFDYYSSIDNYNSFFFLNKFGRKRVTEINTRLEDHKLSPWITWPTIHRGVVPEIHKIKMLGQTLGYIDKYYPPLWDVLSKNNISVGIVGSLHSYSSLDKSQENYKYFLPDSFAKSSETIPEYFSGFQSFNLSQVKVNGRYPQYKINFDRFYEFFKNYIKLGFDHRTSYNILKQLTSEFFDKKKIVRRRSLQASLMFDIFYYHLKKKKADANFFFTNHVASAMHRYWPSIFPEDYKKMCYEKNWIENWKHEIPFAIKLVDFQLNKLINFVDKNHEYKLCIISSMGQAAVEKTQLEKTQIIIKDLSKLLSLMDIKREEYSENIAMAPQISLKLLSKTAINKIQENLGKLKINGKVIKIDLNTDTGDCLIDIHITNDEKIYFTYDNIEIDKSLVGIKNMKVLDQAGTNAYHINQGIYIEYCNNFKSNKQDYNWRKVDATSIFYDILNNFNILNR